MSQTKFCVVEPPPVGVRRGRSAQPVAVVGGSLSVSAAVFGVARELLGPVVGGVHVAVPPTLSSVRLPDGVVGVVRRRARE